MSPPDGYAGLYGYIAYIEVVAGLGSTISALCSPRPISRTIGRACPLGVEPIMRPFLGSTFSSWVCAKVDSDSDSAGAVLRRTR